MMSPLLEVIDLSVHAGARALVRGLSFTLGAGELLGLIGPNGAGKSTAVKALAQLLPYRGQIKLHNQPLDAMPAVERARRLAYLSQDAAVPWAITVQDLVGLGRYPHRRQWWVTDAAARAADVAAVESALRATDVWELRSRVVTELSGGELARVRLARVLAVQASVLLADEPFAALDPRHQLQMMTLLRAHCRLGAGVVLVLHDLTLASRFCDRLLLLDQGAMCALGAPNAVLNDALLRQVYGIEAVSGIHQQQRYILPWATSEMAHREPQNHQI